MFYSHENQYILLDIDIEEFHTCHFNRSENGWDMCALFRTPRVAVLLWVEGLSIYLSIVDKSSMFSYISKLGKR